MKLCVASRNYCLKGIWTCVLSVFYRLSKDTWIYLQPRIYISYVPSLQVRPFTRSELPDIKWKPAIIYGITSHSYIYVYVQNRYDKTARWYDANKTHDRFIISECLSFMIKTRKCEAVHAFRAARYITGSYLVSCIWSVLIYHSVHTHAQIYTPIWSETSTFLAATKQLYEWYFLSVCLSVCPSVTPFWLCSHHRIIMKFSGVITLDQGKVHAKGQGQRSRSQRSRPKCSFPDCNSSLNSHMMMKWYI